MDNKDNELFNGIMDIPSTNTNNENNIQPNLQFFENQVSSQPINNNIEVIGGLVGMNQPQPEIIDVQPSYEVPVVDLAQDSQNNILNNQNIETSLPSTGSPEVIDFETPVEQINEQGKPINHELLKTLNNDTKNLVNPDMIINPLGKQEQSRTVNVEEPKVNYDETKTKKGYVFMAIIFLIIIVFIIFLPQIMNLLGI